MTDRKLGYVLMCLSLLIFAVVAAYCLRPFLSPGETRVVVFKHIGNLRLEDPVRVRGVSYGTVKRIDWTNDPAARERKVYVSVESPMPIPIRKGYAIANMDEGIMGDRVIMIDCGDSAAPLISPRDTLAGAFYPGVSEALNEAWKLRDAVDTFLVVSDRLAHGTRAQKSLIVEIRGAIAFADSLSGIVLRATRETDARISSRIDSLDAFVKQTALVSRTFAAATPAYLDNIQSELGRISGFAASLDSASRKLLAMSGSLQNPQNILWKSDAENLRKRLVELQDVTAAIQKRLLQFKIYLRLM
jgi:ABC-type transporter Mla subunit MlaD